MKTRPYTDHEWETLPHIVITDDKDWDPTVLDFNPTEDEVWYDTLKEEDDANGDTPDKAILIRLATQGRVALSVTQEYVSAWDLRTWIM